MTDRVPPRVDLWCDLQCPDCRDALDDLAAIRERYGDELVLELRHLPLEKHRNALIAAQAAEEARAQGALWPYVTAVLDRVGELARANEADAEKLLVRVAAQIGLDAGEMELALVDGRHFLQVDMDHAEGLALGLRGTPTYEVAGTFLDGGKDRAGLRERVAELLDR
jgi:protein-disulfide isomerase